MRIPRIAEDEAMTEAYTDPGSNGYIPGNLSGEWPPLKGKQAMIE
jgi:hypothetical protein